MMSAVISLIPLVSPALKKDSCKLDYDLLGKRIMAVFLVCIGLTIAVPFALPCVFSASLTGLLIWITLPIVTICAVPLLDWHLSNVAADVKAVNEYLTQPYPSKSAAFHIQHHFSAAQLLVNKQGNLNKLTTEGEHLLGYLADPKVFKLFIQQGANIRAADQYGVSVLQRAVAEKKAVYLKHLLKTQTITPQTLSPDEQVDLWTKIGSGEAAHLLRHYGFNPNIRDHRGYTPLLEVVKRPYSSLDRLSIGTHVTVLLQCGADKLMTVVDSDGVTKNAMQLSNDPMIQRLLA